MINEDGTTEVKAIERVNKQHLVQALLMLATAETEVTDGVLTVTLGPDSDASRLFPSGQVKMQVEQVAAAAMRVVLMEAVGRLGVIGAGEGRGGLRGALLPERVP